MLTQEDIINKLVQEGLTICGNLTIEEIIIGESLILVKNSQSTAGLSAAFLSQKDIKPATISLKGKKIRDILPWLFKTSTLKCSIALATFNSLFQNQNFQEKRVQELLIEIGTNKKLALIGHFPFVHKIKSHFKKCWILELNPRPGDFPASKAKEILPKVDIVAITGTTILNGTLAEILTFTSSKALKIMLGPSTPIGNSLFSLGFTYLGGAMIDNFQKAKSGIEKNMCFKNLKGTKSVLKTKPSHI
ncbi:hypothetical protein SAMN04488516_102200 [Desulfonauticus submarinus]|uniref:Heavy-metal chelation n=1 Tax=Desulfonauticus submarinus TaxID=206665 RepID=A0A1H0BK11_9BACT|nr:DUF364 domain-containing protein [Desulfonauticus submarinus]SDN45989.1 hypothetical protein SAMN04488516_102200 [Desulfonauticus submarinus]